MLCTIKNHAGARRRGGLAGGRAEGLLHAWVREGRKVLELNDRVHSVPAARSIERGIGRIGIGDGVGLRHRGAPPGPLSRRDGGLDC